LAEMLVPIVASAKQKPTKNRAARLFESSAQAPTRSLGFPEVQMSVNWCVEEEGRVPTVDLVVDDLGLKSRILAICAESRMIFSWYSVDLQQR
jgi:hypothetical protein